MAMAEEIKGLLMINGIVQKEKLKKYYYLHVKKNYQNHINTFVL